MTFLGCLMANIPQLVPLNGVAFTNVLLQLAVHHGRRKSASGKLTRRCQFGRFTAKRRSRPIGPAAPAQLGAGMDRDFTGLMSQNGVSGEFQSGRRSAQTDVGGIVESARPALLTSAAQEQLFGSKATTMERGYVNGSAMV